MADSLVYVYGIVASDFAPHGAPAGLEDAPITLQVRYSLAALVSTLDGSDYSPSEIESKSADVDWLGPRAVAHDAVLSWVSDNAPVVPLPMFSIFSSTAAVTDMLRERADSLSAALQTAGRGREFALRVYRTDAELLGAIGGMSPRLRELEDAAAAAAPGQRYLMERKLDGERKAELRVVGQRVATEVHDALVDHSVEAVRSPIPQGVTAEGSGVMVLNSAFLVSNSEYSAFQLRLSELVAEYGARGFRFDFTGPWPAYHFVGEAVRGA